MASSDPSEVLYRKRWAAWRAAEISRAVLVSAVEPHRPWPDPTFREAGEGAVRVYFSPRTLGMFIVVEPSDDADWLRGHKPPFTVGLPPVEAVFFDDAEVI